MYYRQPKMVPAQAQGYYQARYQEQPISVGQTTTQNESKWKTIGLWVTGVVAATTISYFVTKALRSAEDRVANRRQLKEPEPSPSFEPILIPPPPPSTSASQQESDNDGLVEKLLKQNQWLIKKINEHDQILNEEE